MSKFPEDLRQLTPRGCYEIGFRRACRLILGTKIKWKPIDLKLRNEVTRELFGRKRTK